MHLLYLYIDTYLYKLQPHCCISVTIQEHNSCIIETNQTFCPAEYDRRYTSCWPATATGKEQTVECNNLFFKIGKKTLDLSKSLNYSSAKSNYFFMRKPHICIKKTIYVTD